MSRRSLTARAMSWLVAVTCAAGLAVWTPSPALAADGWQRAVDVAVGPTDDGESVDCLTAPSLSVLFDAGEGCFQPYDEVVWIRDLYANHIPVAVQWWYVPPGKQTATRWGVIFDDFGKASGWTNANKSFDEHGVFRFRVCEVDLSVHSILTNECSGTKDMYT